MRRKTTTLAVLSLIAGWGACADEAPPAADNAQPATPTVLQPPQVTDFSDPAWSATPDPSDVLATVGGARISMATAREAAALSPLVSPREAAERLIELEVLAQEAVRRGLQADPEVRTAWREALVQAQLRAFEAALSPEDMPLDQVRRIYQIPRIRQRYDHFDAWKMSHLMLSCCNPTAEQCDTPEIVQCFEDAGRAIQEVYAEVKAQARDAEPDPDAVDEVMRAYREANDVRWANFAYRERPFYYDPKKSHADQKGYDIVAEEVARTVIEAPLGVLQEPVQSAFGWHIILKRSHEPEVRKGPDDPDVIADIRANAFPGFRRARFGEWLDGLVSAAQPQVFPDRLDALDASVGSTPQP